MDTDPDHEYIVSDMPNRSGKIVIAGAGYLIAMVPWVYEWGMNGGNEALLYAGLALLHGVIGVLLLLKVRVAWYLGLVLAVVAIAVAVITQRFPLTGFDALFGALLFLSRSDFFPRSASEKR